MVHLAVVGAGELGGACAHALARADVARTLTLVDDRGRVAAGKALDISQAAPLECFATQLAGATDTSAASGADVIVIADRFGAGEWQGEDALMLLKRTAQMAPRAVIVCAGASHRELVDRGVRELKLSRDRLIGSAPEALAAAAKAMTALVVNGSARDVALTVLGAPPAHVVIPWEEATIDGFALTRALDEPTRRRLDAKVRALWPPGPLALAASACRVVAALEGRSRHVASCFIAADQSMGSRTRTAALPVRLGPRGVIDVKIPELSGAERVALENAMSL